MTRPPPADDSVGITWTLSLKNEANSKEASDGCEMINANGLHDRFGKGSNPFRLPRMATVFTKLLPPIVPSDDVIPAHFSDVNPILRGLTLFWTFRFNEILDADKLSGALFKKTSSRKAGENLADVSDSGCVLRRKTSLQGLLANSRSSRMANSRPRAVAVFYTSPSVLVIPGAFEVFDPAHSYSGNATLYITKEQRTSSGPKHMSKPVATNDASLC